MSEVDEEKVKEKITNGATHSTKDDTLPPKIDSGFQARPKVIVPGFNAQRVDRSKWYTCYNLEKRKANGDVPCFYIMTEKYEAKRGKALVAVEPHFVFCQQIGCAVLGGRNKIDKDNIQQGEWEIRQAPQEEITDVAKPSESGNDKSE